MNRYRFQHSRLHRLAGFCILFACLLLPVSASGLEANKSAVALLTAKDAEGNTVSTGTGFVVDPGGTLVTNYHVLVDAASVEALFPNGVKAAVDWALKIDRKKDFAVLKLKDGFYSTLELADSAGLKPYEYTSALGYPSRNVSEERNGEKQIILQTFGYVLGVHPQAYPDFSYIYTTTPFGPGFSGGPLLNQDNKVLGIATVEGRSINLALPIEEVKPYLKAKSRIPLSQILEEDKTAKEALYYKGNFALYAQGDPDRALELFNQALNLDPEFILALYDSAVAYRDLGMPDKTTQSYEKVIRLNPKFPEALSNLGGYYFRSGNIEKAVELFRRAIAHYPNFIQAHSNLGAALNKLGRADEALPHIQKTLELDPEFAIAHYNLGNAYFSLNQWDEAQKAYQKSVSLGVDFLSLHWKLYEIHHGRGHVDEARKQLDIILQMDPENPEARRKRSELSRIPR